MEPTRDEVASITDLALVYLWAGITANLKDGLEAAFGQPTVIRDIVYIPKDLWASTVAAVEIPVPATGDQEATVRDPLPIELGRIAAFRRCARIVMGLPGSEEPIPVPPKAQPHTHVAPARATPGPGATDMRIRTSQVIDPILDTEITPIPACEREAHFTNYQARCGALPRPDCEPTADQLDGANQLLDSGAAP